MKGKVNCTCGWSWNKSDSSKKDMYICHECGRDNSNNMKNGGWLDNYNDSQASAPEGMVGDGFSNVGRNYSPAWGGQFQTGGYLKKVKKTEKDLLKKYVNPAQARALTRAKQQGINTGIHNGPLDAIRHSSSAAAMSSALPTWTNFIPGVAPLKIAATNIAGAAHELNAPNDWKEHASDLYNNFIGSVVGVLPVSEKNKHDLLIQAQKHGVLSDMGDKTPLRKRPAAPQLPQLKLPPLQMGGSVYPVNYVPQAAMGASMPGSVGFTYARTKGIPSNGPYAKKTMASAQNGQEMRYYQNGLDWKPKGMKDGGWLDGYDEAQEGKRVLPNNRALKILADIQKRKQGKGKASTEFSKVKIKDDREEAVKKVDNTSTAYKPKVTDVKKLNVKNKTKAQIAEQERKADEAIAAKRKAVREKADANVLNQWSTELFDSDNWTRQNLEDAGAGLESKFRLSDEPNFFDDYINPASWVGRMSANLGAAPNQIVQQDSMMPLVSSIAEPVLGGAIGEVVGPYISKALRPITRPINEAISPVMKKAGNLFGKQKGKGPNYRLITDEDLSLSDFNKASKQQIKSIGEKNVYKDVAKSESKRHQDLMRDIEEYGEGWKYLDDDIASSAKQAADAKAEWTNYLDAQEANIKANPEYFNNTPDELVYYRGKGLGKEELEQLAKEQVDQWYGIQEYKGTRPNTKGYISDVDDYIGDPKYMLPGNRFNREAMLRDMGDDAMNSFNKMYKNQNWKPNIGDIPLNKQGGVIKSDRGQWDYPGEITQINSPYITMKGVPYDVLGISDTGDTKLMKPGKNYKFKGKKVTEFPMAKNGLRQEQKGLQNLDNLLNFTNYNKPQPGGWLNKYN